MILWLYGVLHFLCGSRGSISVATCRPRGLSKWVISRVISTLNGITLIITLLITDLLSPLGLQVGSISMRFVMLAGANGSGSLEDFKENSSMTSRTQPVL